MKRVVITGVGALTPIGSTYQGYSQALLEGKSGANEITRFDASNFKTRFACEVKDYDPESYFHRREARRLDLFAQFAMVAAEEAFKDSGLDTENLDLERCGVIWGSGIGGFETIEADISEAAVNELKDEYSPRYSPFLIPKLIIDIAPGHISMKYGFQGINYGTVSACASSSHALINAADYIRLGKADVIISGGSEAAVTKAGIGGFSSMKALSERNDDMMTASRPFDLDRDGFVLGEGAGALILEELEHAKKRGANIIAEVMGSGMTADAHHMTAPHPEGRGAKKVMELALEDARMNREEVDYINVHGTSTPLGDIAECKAILNVFQDDAYKLNISSTKSMTGHLLGAAGAIEALAGITAIQNNAIPPTINHFTDDPAFDSKLNLSFNEVQERKVDVILTNTFGFGGHNTSIIIKRYTE